MNLDKTPFCSTIIPTVGRDSLERAVNSVLGQTVNGGEYEVILVNDSGEPLADAEWMDCDRVRIVHTQARNRCVARNAGAAIAQGTYFHFLDDDDYLLPDAFSHLWKAAKDSSAAWVYGGYQLVSRTGTPLESLSPNEQGNCAIRFAVSEWLPLQASLIRAEVFFEVGGFASWESLLGGHEDVDLARQISLRYEIAGTRHMVSVIQFGHQGSTSDYTPLQKQSRKSREKMLGSPEAPRRLLDSARTRPSLVGYWHGRVVWCYLGSVHWNLTHSRPITSVSRLVFSLFMLLASWRHLLSPQFWKGVLGRRHAFGWLTSGQLA